MVFNDVYENDACSLIAYHHNYPGGEIMYGSGFFKSLFKMAKPLVKKAIPMLTKKAMPHIQRKISKVVPAQFRPMVTRGMELAQEQLEKKLAKGRKTRRRRKTMPRITSIKI